MVEHRFLGLQWRGRFVDLDQIYFSIFFGDAVS